MIDLKEIEKTISELKQGKTSFDNCEKLAALFIVHDHLKETPAEMPMPTATPTRSAETYSPFTSEIAHEWTRSMHNEDGTKGEHWNIEQVKKLMMQRGVQYNIAEVYAVINSLYSDYSRVFKKYGFNSPEAYLDLALAWLNDADAVPNKALVYYENIVK